MDENVDIVVPWVNPNDAIWRSSFEFWNKNENGDKDPCRFRDLGTFPFWFRSVEKKCNWFNKIILVLSNKSQIPKWLNINNPKLKIVYHDEFIPTDELPTFNAFVINCYLPFINFISEKYILFNDDFFVVKPILKESFFNKDCIVGKYMDDKMVPVSEWEHSIQNGYDLFTKTTGIKIHYRPDHGPIPHLKSIDLFVWNKLKVELTSALESSKFRKPKNISDWFFFGFYFSLNKAISGRSLTQYYNNCDNYNSEKEIYCFNDNETIKNFDDFKIRVVSFLEKNFKDKSSFEV